MPFRQDIASQYAMIDFLILNKASGSTGNDLPGWVIGIIVVCTFSFVVLVVWMGLRHRRALQDIFFLRVRAPVGSGNFTVDEDTPLLSKKAIATASSSQV